MTVTSIKTFSFICFIIFLIKFSCHERWKKCNTHTLENRHCLHSYIYKYMYILWWAHRRQVCRWHWRQVVGPEDYFPPTAEFCVSYVLFHHTDAVQYSGSRGSGNNIQVVLKDSQLNQEEWCPVIWSRTHTLFTSPSHYQYYDTLSVEKRLLAEFEH